MVNGSGTSDATDDVENLGQGEFAIENITPDTLNDLSSAYALPCLAHTVRSIEESSEFDSSGIRKYLSDSLSNGYFQIVCPISGNWLNSKYSIVLADKTTFVVFDSFMVGIGHLGHGFPITALLIPSQRIFIKLLDDYWAVHERHLAELEPLLLSLPQEKTSRLTLLAGDANFAHHAWNQLSAIEAVVNRPKRTVAYDIIATHQPLGPIQDLFPELSQTVVNHIPDWKLSAENSTGRLILPFGSACVKKSVVDRILRYAQRRAEPRASQIDERLRNAAGPIFWISIRTRNRTAINQIEALAQVIDCFIRIYPDCTIVFDGHSFAMDLTTNPGYQPAVQEQIADEDDSAVAMIVASSKYLSDGSAKYENAVGLTILESILLSQRAAIYFCHHGTVQHKIGWFSSCPGVVHTNKRTTATLPALYVKAQSEVAALPIYVPTELVESPSEILAEDALSRALKVENYYFPSTERLCEFFERVVRTKSREISRKIEEEKGGSMNRKASLISRAWKRIRRLGKATSPENRIFVGNAQRSELVKIADAIKNSGRFDWKFYSNAYTDVPAGAEKALEHFVLIGLSERRHASGKVNPRMALQSAPTDAARDEYIRALCEQDIFPPVDEAHTAACVEAAALIEHCGSFNSEAYYAKVPAASKGHWRAAMHYVILGSAANVEALQEFSLMRYVAQYPDIREKISPLVHWLSFGRHEGRTLPTLDAPWQWKRTELSSPLPDDDVHLERMVGEEFFCRYGFDMRARDSVGLAEQCVADLARSECRLNVSAKPKVSIIVPVYGQLDYVLSCLHSLSNHTSDYSCEIIVCDDATPSEQNIQILSRIPWLRYIRRIENGGFISCCNFAADQANGEVLIFLNSDTRVVEGWLDELVGSFELLDRPGVVGSKLLNADGSLQEAGGIIWRDGSATNYGRNEDSNDPRFCFARAVDYVSGASLAVLTSLWQEIGGFDPHFSPAYCEDVDLSFKIRALGYEAWYQPFSKVIHYEGITHGRDTAVGVKAYQVENLKKLKIRYADAISQHPAVGELIGSAACHRSSKQMIVIDAWTPMPDLDSGSIMTYETMASFRSLGFGQQFLAAHRPLWSRKYMGDLQRRGVHCHYLPFGVSIKEISQKSSIPDLALIYRHEIASLCFDEVRANMTTTPIIFANVDLHYLRESRTAEITSNDRMAAKASITKTAELAFFVKADASFVHTEAERSIILSELQGLKSEILVFPWLAEPEPFTTSFSERKNILFLGNFGHPPNVDSIIYFVKEIWPSLSLKLPPEANLMVVGANPPPEVAALESARIKVTGFVQDLAPYFAESRVFVAPLRFGAGIKGKVISAFAHGVPVVASTMAAEGIGTAESKHLIIRDRPDEVTDAVLDLYGNEEKWRQVQQAALSFMESAYSKTRALEICSAGFRSAQRTWLRRADGRRRAVLGRLLADDDR